MCVCVCVYIYIYIYAYIHTYTLIYKISPHHCCCSHGDTEMNVTVPTHSGNCLIRKVKHTCKYLRAQAENKLRRRIEAK